MAVHRSVGKHSHRTDQTCYRVKSPACPLSDTHSLQAVGDSYFAHPLLSLRALSFVVVLFRQLLYRSVHGQALGQVSDRPATMFGRRFLAFDLYEKPSAEAVIRTTSGGIVTLVSTLVIVVLLIGEWNAFRKVTRHPELVVDTARQERMNINIDVTFPQVPCTMLSLDLMDNTGEQQHDILHDMVMERLDEKGHLIESKKLELGHSQDGKPVHPPDYCGPCYGAKGEGECCNTCDDVRNAYSQKGWQIDNLDAITQCKEEHYKEKLAKESHEGCHVRGALHVNKVIGSFHFAPGRTIVTDMGHMHDIHEYMMDTTPHTFTHTIHHLSFGAPEGGRSHYNPLDQLTKQTDEPAHHFAYFLKCVSRTLRPLSGKDVETMTYSATAHDRSIFGGADKSDPSHINARGGVPGLFVNYDISPLKIIDHERRGSFSTFLVGAMSSIGGVLALGAFFDRAAFEIAKRVKRE